MSLDGFIARDNGGLYLLPGAQQGDTGNRDSRNEDYRYHEFIDSVDVLFMERNTYESVLGIVRMEVSVS